MNKKLFNFTIANLLLSILLMQTILPVLSYGSTLTAISSKTCEQKLSQAEELYYKALFDQAIDIIRQCIKEPELSKNNRLRSYRLLTRIFLAKNEAKKAQKIAEKIVQLDPSYEPTIEKEKPDYIQLINKIKAEQPSKNIKKSSKKTNSTKWWWIGAGVAVVGATAIIISVGNSGDNNNTQSGNLAEPPQYPTN